ncbi:hypothetical protein LGQ02_07665 [Bacillus shivajii]|uniref:putative cytokinetic ring protein SteA n=1 Tax=Bacillus shivajii TaxID=1983719 RepID=UPI001CFBAC30|nr:putative cytokinetic ring protein SteA [Bacillus shivajii]UCZ54619.1 hypothetical protein LGQ02_07665 [Bacillus shivajii]
MSNRLIVGSAYKGDITKKLLLSIPDKSIIIINHEDIDVVCAEEIVRKKVKAVINLKRSMSGKVPNLGVPFILKHGIPVFDLFKTKSCFIPNELRVQVYNNRLYKENENGFVLIGELEQYTSELCLKRQQEGDNEFPKLFRQFVNNSLSHMAKELDVFYQEIEKLPRLFSIKEERVWIFSRGAGIHDEILFLKPFMKGSGTVIAVDGAANTLYKHGLMPDYIIGDMDSISDDIDKYSSVFIAHSYVNGYSPGKERLQQAGIMPITVSFPGLSEDLAIMLAYISGAKQIITVGCRSSVKELLEKNRQGMASTLLTRMFTGDIIHDWKRGSTIFSLEEDLLTSGLEMTREAGADES